MEKLSKKDWWLAINQCNTNIRHTKLHNDQKSEHKLHKHSQHKNDDKTYINRKLIKGD